MSAATSMALDGELTIYRAAEVRQALLAALSDSPDGLEVDLAAVTEIDSAGVQLLMAAKRSSQEVGQAFALVRHSAAVVDVFEMFDLAGFFGDPMVVAARGDAPGGDAR
ncbi:MAG: STAS domain-containing protein [Xylophilus ampelinus]